MKAPFRYSPYQFALFRTTLGIYLGWHFARLIPYGAELFSSAGALPRAAMTPTYGVFPNILFVLDSPGFVTGFLVFLALSAVAFASGIYRRPAALLLWYGWACLLSRQPFIANPGIPYVGLLLLLCAALPSGEPWRITFGKPLEKSPRDWSMPNYVYVGVWVLMAVGYSASGWHKLQSPSWADGTAMRYLVDNPLARDTFLRRVMLDVLPDWVIAAKTWFALGLELFFLPLCFWAASRRLVWVLMVVMHLGILTLVDFADLTIGMLMVHFFTFDARWVPGMKPKAEPTVVFFDGLCGLCDHFVQFLLEEDKQHVLRFATLQGELAQQTLGPDSAATLMNTVAVKTGDGRVLERSAAVLHVLKQIGGLWRVLATAAWWIPSPARDLLYRGVAKSRYSIFGKLDACRIPTADERAQFLD